MLRGEEQVPGEGDSGWYVHIQNLPSDFEPQIPSPPFSRILAGLCVSKKYKMFPSEIPKPLVYLPSNAQCHRICVGYGLSISWVPLLSPALFWASRIHQGGARKATKAATIVGASRLLATSRLSAKGKASVFNDGSLPVALTSPNASQDASQTFQDAFQMCQDASQTFQDASHTFRDPSQRP